MALRLTCFVILLTAAVSRSGQKNICRYGYHTLGQVCLQRTAVDSVLPAQWDAGEDRLKEAEISLVRKRWTPGGWVVPRLPGHVAYFDIHIPRTAGASFSKDVKKVLPQGQGYWSKERCLGPVSAMQNGDGSIAFFRDPVAHVHSQFLECQGWDPHWHPIVNPWTWFWHFKDVTSWLQWFRAGAQTDDFGCYHPYNMQTRALLCEDRLPDSHHYMSQISVKDALARLETLVFLGITEHYQASVCLFAATSSFMQTLPDFCNCTDKAAWNSFSSTHEAHGVPEHSRNDLTQNDISMIRELTQYDAKIYERALAMFKQRVANVETHFNVQLLC